MSKVKDQVEEMMKQPGYLAIVYITEKEMDSQNKDEQRQLLENRARIAVESILNEEQSTRMLNFKPRGDKKDSIQ